MIMVLAAFVGMFALHHHHQQQDSMFLKRPGDGDTRWHSDLHMAPFDTNHMVTCWIPLDHVLPQVAVVGPVVKAVAKWMFNPSLSLSPRLLNHSSSTVCLAFCRRNKGALA